MSRVDELYARMGQQQGQPDIVVNHGDPEQVTTGQRYKLTKANIVKALSKMPDEAALWSPNGLGEYDAKQVMRDELWKMVEKRVQTYQYAPDGKTLIEVK